MGKKGWLKQQIENYFFFRLKIYMSELASKVAANY